MDRAANWCSHGGWFTLALAINKLKLTAPKLELPHGRLSHLRKSLKKGQNRYTHTSCGEPSSLLLTDQVEPPDGRLSHIRKRLKKCQNRYTHTSCGEPSSLLLTD